MNRIDNVSNNGQQSLQIILPDGSTASLDLHYVDNEQGWFFSINQAASGFTVTNRRLTASPNMLRAFRRVINWGLACNTTDGQEPVFLNDFYTGRASLYILNEADVLEVEQLIAAIEV